MGAIVPSGSPSSWYGRSTTMKSVTGADSAARRKACEGGLDTEIDESQCGLGFALRREASDTQVHLNDQIEVIHPGTGTLDTISALGLGN